MTYYVADGTDPYRNLALEELLLGAAVPGDYLLYLWQNDNTIVVGHNQDAYVECRADEFMTDGGRIARRLSGGGAVYHDLGNLNYTLIADNAVFDKQTCYDVVLRTLTSLGLQADFNGRNDLTINGRKFSGNAHYDNGRVSYQHGTILVGCDIRRMTRYLTPAESKLQRNAVASVSSRVLNLSEVLPSISVESVRSKMLELYGTEQLVNLPDEKEIAQLAAKYASAEWIYRRIQS
ncbi:MAG: lipoate--protein ligase [Clostridium sp.]|jgi:lipoate-protein ligase A|nr:lipoate--protein ligase [Clostridium sp.]